ncbi:Ca-activated chloride channel family protein [Pontibacter aydingkolensis]|uniref:von Willebrand factor type A domain-containing protein n=1 Tax=Pontibacter aydingkolensis TaxID=1911536 RepID=A0ABS7CYU2_9BACT|nr:VWA domain-containing protein [Pontibacter aydingkolensis]MBW7468672.1 von Willebrand factor type A domain-containing protein [Pontibacter aydingkolensis]
MKKHIYLLLVLLIAGLQANAQGRMITGIITDAQSGNTLPGVSIMLKGTTSGTSTNKHGKYNISVPDEKSILIFRYIGYATKEVKVGNKQQLDVAMEVDNKTLDEVIVTGYGIRGLAGKVAGVRISGNSSQSFMAHEVQLAPPVHNTENYNYIKESTFQDAKKTPLSTFSIDVDNASYSNVRRFLNQGQKPPVDAVRIEEMINYFSYDYKQPTGDAPFSVTTELSDCPWNKDNQLLHIGLQGKNISTEKLPASNLVFLIDVSGSMSMTDKLPLVKAGFKLLVDQLRPQDKVAIVVYAGAAGLVLPSTSGEDKPTIMQAIENLQAGGSTAGGAGINLAYKVAQENFVKGGNNRVILASDGDFNVGVSSDSELQRIIEKKRESGVFLTVLGFGTGNLKDSRMEQLANKGNGNYAYVDNILEAKKVFVNEFGGTLFTIAKDVKLQLEFNPAKVKAYRLIGYENRALADEEFNDDKKDAGDMGAGHTVTALYEIVPVGAKSATTTGDVDPLKYQKSQLDPKANSTNEMLTLKLRYKEPDGNKSKLITTTATDNAVAVGKTSDDFRFSAAIAACGMLLRDSKYKGNATYPMVLELAQNARGNDEEGYRIEFINLVKSMSLLSDRR